MEKVTKHKPLSALYSRGMGLKIECKGEMKLKCMHCGAEMPDEANFCAVCAKPLKNNVKRDAAVVATNQEMQKSFNKKKSAKFGWFALIIGIVSMLLSCLYLGFLGIPGIIFGIVSLAKGEHGKGKAVSGIVCSVVAVFVTFCVLMAESEGNVEDSTYQIEQAEAGESKVKETEEPTPEPTPEPTLSPEEIKENIKKALIGGKEKELKNYSAEEVSELAETTLKNLTFEENEDYTTANTVASVMVSLYPKGSKVKRYKSIVSNYQECIEMEEAKEREEYKGIKKKWERISEVKTQIVEKTLDVQYDIEANSSEMDEIIDIITGEEKEYEHAYYAVGYKFDLIFGTLETDEDDEYVICTQDAFPKAGRYSLKLIPTGSSMHLTNSRGFERDVPTYTIVTEEEEAEYERIEELSNDYDELKWIEKVAKNKIRKLCASFENSGKTKQENI